MAPGPLYEVTVHIDAAVAAEWLDWMRTVHLPDILATGCFHRATVTTAGEAGGRTTFVLEYLAGSPALYERYQREFAPGLQASHTSRYAGRFEASRQVREVAFELPPLA